MASPIDLIVVPFHDLRKWTIEGWRTRDAHLVDHFLKDSRVGRVLIINRPVSLIEMIIRHGVWYNACDEIILSASNMKLGRIDEKLYFLDQLIPSALSVVAKRKGWWQEAYSSPSLHRSIMACLESLDMRNANLLLMNPMSIGLIDSFSYQHLVFDAIDNWTVHPQMKSNSRQAKEGYEVVKRKAELITTVSESLTSLFVGHPNVHQIPNGVDIKLFSKAMKTLSSHNPIIGYVGKIQDRVDFGLIEHCVKLFPSYIFKFIGPVYTQHKAVKKLKTKYNNVIFTGDIKYQDLPAAMKDIDIAIIPHKVNQFTNSMNPLKLYEYLAAGKPVVSTPVAGVENVSKHVYIADTPSTFGKALSSVVELIDKGLITSKSIIQCIPDQYTWDDIEKNYIDMILELD